MVKFFILVILLSSSLERIIFGILTQPCNPGNKCSSSFNVSIESEYIISTYIQYLESANATVIPISYRINISSLKKLMKLINGVLFTGGEQNFFECDNYNYPINYTQFAWTAHKILSIAKEMNDEGTYFPVWGTCMGFQFLSIDGANDYTTLKKCQNSYNYMATLKLTNNAYYSKFFNFLSPISMLKLETTQYTLNNHGYCIFEDYLTQDFNNMYNILSFSDPNIGSRSFVSLIEGKKYPFYGSQFHPETWQYSTSKTLNVTHNLDTMELGQEMSNFLVNEARKNNNTMDYNLLRNISVYSFTYSFDQSMTYVFDLTNFSQYPFILDSIVPPIHQSCG